MLSVVVVVGYLGARDDESNTFINLLAQNFR